MLFLEQPTYLAPISAIRYQPKYTNFQIRMAVIHQLCFGVYAPCSDVGAKTQRITIIRLPANGSVNNQHHTS